MFRNFVSPQIKDEKKLGRKELPFNDETTLVVEKSFPLEIQQLSKAHLRARCTAKKLAKLLGIQSTLIKKFAQLVVEYS